MAIPPYRTLDSFTSVPMIFGDNSNTVNGLVNNVIGNPSLKWESTTTANIAVDFAVLKNRISGTLELWQSHSNNLLMSQSVPVMNGYQTVWNNVGELGNKGIELSLNTVNIIKGNFSWNSYFNFSSNRDKVLALASGQTEDLANLWIVGQRLHINYNYKMIGVWQLGQEAQIAASPQAGEVPGNARILDVNGDGKLDASDKVVQGSPTPNWRAGITNEFKYKRWTLTVFINAVWGNHIDNAFLNPVDWPLAPKNSNFPNVGYWSPTNPTNKMPDIGYQDPWFLGYYEDASFVRIKDVTLSYNFSPKGIIRKWGIDNLQLSVNCKNLYCFTNFIGWDPEEPVSGNSAQTTDPCPRELSFSIKIDF